jgi:N-acetylmuramic acid 6-phosphate etherase
MRRGGRRGDALVGIAASGVTPFVRAALAEAGRRGAFTALITCNPGASRRSARVVIALRVGPEVLAGSTRLKAGTATKLALNTIGHGHLTRLARSGNRTVDLQPKSLLRARAARLVAELGGVGRPRVASAPGSWLSAKVAIVMARRGESAAGAATPYAARGFGPRSRKLAAGWGLPSGPR